MNNNLIAENDIDLMVLLKAIWSKKIMVLAITLLFTLIGLFRVLNMPDVYTSSAILLTEKEPQIGLSGSLSRLSGLSGLSSSSNNNNRVETTLKLLESKSFIYGFITKNGYVADIYAANGWLPSVNQITYNNDIYDEGKWLREKSLLKSSMPTARELKSAFLKNNLDFNFDSRSGFLSISITHYSPFYAQEVLSKLVEHINTKAREKAVKDSVKKIDYLRNAINGANDNSLKTVFNTMIVEEEKERMLATVKSDYIFSVIEPATIPDIKSGPNRMLILTAFIFAGILISLISVAIRVFFFEK